MTSMMRPNFALLHESQRALGFALHVAERIALGEKERDRELRQ